MFFIMVFTENLVACTSTLMDPDENASRTPFGDLTNTTQEGLSTLNISTYCIRVSMAVLQEFKKKTLHLHILINCILSQLDNINQILHHNPVMLRSKRGKETEQDMHPSPMSNGMQQIRSVVNLIKKGKLNACSLLNRKVIFEFN